MKINNVRLTTKQGVIGGDFILYRSAKDTLLTKVNKIQGSLLSTTGGLVDEDTIDVLAHSYTIHSLLDSVKTIELMVADSIFLLSVLGEDRKAQISHMILNEGAIILNVEMKGDVL